MPDPSTQVGERAGSPVAQRFGSAAAGGAHAAAAATSTAPDPLRSHPTMQRIVRVAV